MRAEWAWQESNLLVVKRRVYSPVPSPVRRHTHNDSYGARTRSLPGEQPERSAIELRNRNHYTNHLHTESGGHEPHTPKGVRLG